MDIEQPGEGLPVRRAVGAWSQNPHIEILGNPAAERLSVISFVIRRPAGRYLHHNFVVALLNDLFGIQARGGCSCAGPYGHSLLGIGEERSAEFEHEIAGGCEGIKPGWVRVNFNYFIAEPVFRYLVEAVDFVADHGARLLADYRFDVARGLWCHRDGPVEPAVRLYRLRYDSCGRLCFPTRHTLASEDDLPGYPDQARRLVAARPEPTPSDGTAGIGGQFDELRWFDLPQRCLERLP
jgi:hypothetical protein